MPTVIPSYCNPFFRRCKHIFSKFQKNFSGKGKKRPNLYQSFPYFGHHRPQQPSRPPNPQKTAREHPRGGAEPHIPPADAESEINRGPQGGQDEQAVGQGGVPGPQRPQKFIPRTQSQAEQHGLAKPGRGHRRGRHPSRRRSQPPWRGSSYRRADTWPSTATCPPSTERVFNWSPWP